MPNPWDVSQILLSNNAGARFGSGIASFGESIGNALQGAVMEHRRKKLEKESELAAVNWLKDKGATFFPSLNTADDAELKSVVKAAGGGRQAIQLISGLEAQQQQRAAAAQQQQVVAAQLARVEQERSDALRRSGAARLASGGRPNRDEITAMALSGDSLSVPMDVSPEAAVQNYLARTGDAAGASGLARTFSELQEMRSAGEQFRPELIELAPGVTGMTTSRKSAIPVQKGEPASRPQSPQGKLMADADALEKAGRTAEAQSLRALATTPRAGGGRPMSATDWILTGGDPTEYRSYVEGFNAKPSATPAPADAEPQFGPEMEGKRVRGPDGKIYVIRNGRPVAS